MVGYAFDQMQCMEGDTSGPQAHVDDWNWLDLLKGNDDGKTQPQTECVSLGKSAEHSERKALTTPFEKKIEWHTDIFKAYDQAALEHKPLIVKFETDWCDYCKELDKTVLTDQRFVWLGDKAVFVAANPEKDKVAADLGTQLGVDGYPTVVVMDAKPNMLDERGRVVGYLPVEKFMPQLEKLLPKDAMVYPQPILVDSSLSAQPDGSERFDENRPSV